MKSNFSFKFFACAMLLAFSVLSGGGCGGSSSHSPGTPVLRDVFDEASSVKVGFTYFGEQSSATFKHAGEAFVLAEKGGNFSDSFSNANAWKEEENFVVQLYLEKGWELGVAIASENGLPTDDVWEIVFASDSDTYQDHLRTGVFKTASEDFQVTSVVVNGVDIIDTLEPLPYEEPEIPEPTPTPEDPSDNGNNGSSDGTGGGNPPAPTPSTIAVTSVSLNSSDISLGIGKTATLVATVLPTNATNATVTWSTTNPTVATVANGVVTGVSAGTATITATAGGKSASCTVKVGVEYLSRSFNGTAVVTETKVAVDYVEVTTTTSSFEDGKYYVVSGDVSIDASSGSVITAKGTAHLILCDGATLTAGKGISVSDGSNNSFPATLHIYAQSDANAGHLVATGSGSGSGIGGKGSNGGTLYIHGGVITATGGSYTKGTNVMAAAGIGGSGGSYGNGGNVYIYGGTVTATGGHIDPSTTGMGIGAGDGSTINGSLTIGAGLTVSYSDDGTNYNNYTGSDYSTRHQYMKVEPSSSSN